MSDTKRSELISTQLRQIAEQAGTGSQPDRSPWTPERAVLCSAADQAGVDRKRWRKEEATDWDIGNRRQDSPESGIDADGGGL